MSRLTTLLWVGEKKYDAVLDSLLPVAVWDYNETSGVTVLDRKSTKNGTYRNTAGVLNGVTLAQPGISNGKLSVLLDGASGLANLFSVGITSHPQNELVNNGGFDSDASWTKGIGWTISGGVAAHAAGSASDLSISGVFLAGWGLNYTVTFTVTGQTAGSVTPKMGTKVLTTRTENGPYTESAVHAGTSVLTFSASADFDGSIDNVSVRTTSGSGFNGRCFSLVLWRKIASTEWLDSTYRRLFYLQADSNNRVYVAKSSANNTLVMGCTAGGVDRYSTITTNTEEWMMFVITLSLANNEVKFYLNTQQQGASQIPGAFVGHPITIVAGALDTGGTSPHKGYMANDALFDRILTQSEINSLYKASRRIPI